MIAIGEYGVGLNIFEAGSIYECMLGVRNNYDKKRALYVNSMFLEYIKDNGLNVSKSGFTKDIITINFGYGSSSFEKEKGRLEANLRKDPDNEFFKELYKNCLENESLYEQKSADEIREIFYSPSLAQALDSPLVRGGLGYGPGRNHRLLPALAKNMPPACFLTRHALVRGGQENVA